MISSENYASETFLYGDSTMPEHEILHSFASQKYFVLIELGVFSPQIRVIGKSDINVCVLINQRFTCGTLNE